MALKTTSELLTELALHVRSGGKTTANDLRVFLTSLIETVGQVAEQLGASSIPTFDPSADEGKTLKIVAGVPVWVLTTTSAPTIPKPAAPTIYNQSSTAPNIYLDFALSPGFAPTDHEISFDYGSSWARAMTENMVSGHYRFYVAAGTYPIGAICFRVRASAASGDEHAASNWASNSVLLQAQESAQNITLADVELFGTEWSASTTHPTTQAFGYPNRARFHFQRGIKLNFPQGSGIGVKWSLNGGEETDQDSSAISFEVHDLEGDNYVEIYRYKNGSELALDLTNSLKYI